jgi:nucleotide-binding universal stress UspA family protein
VFHFDLSGHAETKADPATQPTRHSGADMIAMSTHGRKGLNHLVTGSVAEDIVNHIDCPIWTCVEK